MRRAALGALAAYYVVTGAWPLLHMRSFEAVTGPKVDKWLVKMVGALAVGNGLALSAGALRERPSAETRVLAACSAAAFCAIDIIYVARGRIAPIYLGDVPVELVLAGMILAGD
jgi:hypothetical protein